MTAVALLTLGAALALTIYAYAGYPAVLALLGFLRRFGSPVQHREWPVVSITVPAYNEEAVIRATLDRILQLDYPPNRRQIVVVSDASTDRTDAIVREYADRGVQLIRLPERRGKTGAENLAREYLIGEIVVNTDASVRVRPDSLKSLIAVFADPTVGVASGCDVSVSDVVANPNLGESGYVGYEMWVRDLETRVSGIVGASGCLYASRTPLHMQIVPEALSRDFAAPLIARENGFRAVSVREAVCFVPRVPSARHEYRRKVRTMTRGLETLYYKRRLLNPGRYGLFAWMLWSHKVVRWLVPWAVLGAALALVALAPTVGWARWMLAGGAAVLGLAAAGWWWPRGRRAPHLVAISSYLVSSLAAGIHSWVNALRGDLNPIWEPTRRTRT